MSVDPADREALSRLLDGDLPPDEAEVLRARLAREPDLRGSWEALGRVTSDLEGLAEAPPRSLDAAVLGDPVAAGATDPRFRRRMPPGWNRVTLGAASLLVAAALALWVLRPVDPPASVILLDGTHRLQGQIQAVAGVVPVAVDGIAVITVEPDGPLPRASAQEDPMTRTVLASALAGALLTVAVYEGRAVLTGSDGRELVVEAGQTASLEGPTLRSRPQRVIVQSDVPSPHLLTPPPDDLVALRAENAALRKRLAEAEFEGAVTRGQLASHQGDPVPWPADVPAWATPDGLRKGLDDVLAQHPDARLAALDCEEFPCIAVITGPNHGSDPEKGLTEIPRALADQLGPDEPVSLAVMVERADDPEVPMAVGFVLAPADQAQEPGVATRAEYRARQLLESVGPQER